MLYCRFVRCLYVFLSVNIFADLIDIILTCWPFVFLSVCLFPWLYLFFYDLGQTPHSLNPYHIGVKICFTEALLKFYKVYIAWLKLPPPPIWLGLKSNRKNYLKKLMGRKCAMNVSENDFFIRRFLCDEDFVVLYCSLHLLTGLTSTINKIRWTKVYCSLHINIIRWTKVYIVVLYCSLHLLTGLTSTINKIRWTKVYCSLHLWPHFNINIIRWTKVYIVVLYRSLHLLTGLTSTINIIRWTKVYIIVLYCSSPHWPHFHNKYNKMNQGYIL